jgi:flavin reductase (DIM6/NTAB) family NADH-FMN oxidoreductase RutF
MDGPKQEIPVSKANAVLELLPPFPIVLVTTRTNIITIGQIEYFTFSPLRIGIAVAHSRHTYSLLRTEREFVVNVPDAAMLDAVKVCGSISGRDHNKFEAAGLTPVESIQVNAVSIEECGAHIECVVEREIEFEERTWFVGKVVAARSRADHRGTEALLSGRTEYALPGKKLAPR